MTGFARAEAAMAICWTWEIKSVNGRSLDLRCACPRASRRWSRPCARRAREAETRQYHRRLV